MPGYQQPATQQAPQGAPQPSSGYAATPQPTAQGGALSGSSGPQGLDLQAIRNDPQAYAQWQQQAAAAGYNYGPEGQALSGGPGGAGGQSPYLSAINPGADLRGQQVLPGQDPRLAAMTGQADQARQAMINAPNAPAFRSVPTAGSPYTQQADNWLQQAGSSLPAGGYQQVGAGTMGGQAGSLLQQAIGAAQGIGGASFGADVGASREAAMRALQAMETGPNRGELASKQFDLMREASNPAFEADLRRVGQRASALGRVGAGMTTSDLGTVQQRREEALSQAAKGLSLDAAGQEMNDRLSRVSAAQGLAGTFGNLDLGASDLNTRAASNRAGTLAALSGDVFNREGSLRDEARAENNRGLQYGINQGNYLNNLGQTAFDRGSALRGEDRIERNTERDFANDDFGRVRTKAQDLNQVMDNERAWGQSDRNELRGERDYQNYMNDKAMGAGIDQTLMEEQLLNGQFGRNLDATKLQGGMGYGTDPTGVLTGQANAYSRGAANNFAGGADLLGEALAGRVPNQMTPGQVNSAIRPRAPNVVGGGLAPRPIDPVKPWTAPVPGQR